MSTLYETSRILAQLKEADLDELTPDQLNYFFEKELAGKDQFQEKVNNYGLYIKELEARAEVRKTEAIRLTELATSDEAIIKKLKIGLLHVFNVNEIKKFQTSHFAFTVANNGGKVPVLMSDNFEPEKLPNKYKLVKTTYSADKEAIRTALERGETLLFAKLGERGVNLRIK